VPVRGVQPNFADSTCCLAIFAAQVIEGQGAPRAKIGEIGCSADQVYSQGCEYADNLRPSFSCASKIAEGWQPAPLLERCREHAGCRGPRGAAARAVFGRDQQHAGAGLAAVDRGFGGWGNAAADIVAVPGRPLRRLLADASIVRLKLSELRLRRTRQWGACWLSLTLWRKLQLDLFWSELL
jgi:hypothetical protein